MKKSLVLIVCLFLFSGAIMAQDNTTTTSETTAKTESGPKMVFTSKTVDYGTIEQHSDPLRVFTFTNTGDEPLQIKHAKGSCGCTVPTWPHEPIAPGATATVEVRYDTKRVGPFTKRVTLTTNETNPKTVLTIKGKVLKKEKKEAIPAGAQKGLK